MVVVLRAWVVVGMLCSAVVASADSKSEALAARRFAAATTHYTAGRYTEAIAELRAAHQADPQPEYLFGIAQAYKYAGDCDRAIESYGVYLRTGPTPGATKATQALIDECRDILAAAKAAQPVATATPPVAVPAPPPPASEPLVIREVQRVHTRELYIPWYRDWQGDVLTGAGVVGLFTGAAFLAAAQRHDDDATRAASYADLDRAVRARDRDEVIGGVVLATGGALVLAGLVRYALRPKRVRTEVIVEPSPGGAVVGLVWSGW